MMKQVQKLMLGAVAVLAASLLPPDWLTTGAAVGSVEHCVERLSEYIEAGADRILLHGTTPEQQGPLVTAMRGSEHTPAR